jgi:hypothetical protein
MQVALLRAKRDGLTHLEGLGRFTWNELVALVDVLISMVWADLTLTEQKEIFLLYTSDPGPEHADPLVIADRNRLCRHLHLPSEDPWTAGPNN